MHPLIVWIIDIIIMIYEGECAFSIIHPILALVVDYVWRTIVINICNKYAMIPSRAGKFYPPVRLTRAAQIYDTGRICHRKVMKTGKQQVVYTVGIEICNNWVIDTCVYFASQQRNRYIATSTIIIDLINFYWDVVIGAVTCPAGHDHMHAASGKMSRSH